MSLIELGLLEARSQKDRVVSFGVIVIRAVNCLKRYVVLGVKGSYLMAKVDSSGSFMDVEASLIGVIIDKAFGFQRMAAIVAFDFPYLGMTLIQQIDCNSLGFHLHNFSN